MMADPGTPGAGAMTPNPAAPSTGKQPLVYICGGRGNKNEVCECVGLAPCKIHTRKLC